MEEIYTISNTLDEESPTETVITFEQPLYSAEISEKATVGTPVVQVKAMTDDVSYSLTGSDAFAIDKDTGENSMGVISSLLYSWVVSS